MAETNRTPDEPGAALPADRAVEPVDQGEPAAPAPAAPARAVAYRPGEGGATAGDTAYEHPDAGRERGPAAAVPPGEARADETTSRDERVPAATERDDRLPVADEPEHARHAAAVPVDDATPAPPPAPAQQQPVLAPAQDGPVPPKRRSNRLVGTMWVLLAAGLFEVLYIALVALLVLLLGGAAAVGPETTVIVSSPFGWLPVVFFFLFFELTVLLINRAGRFAYVVASLIVGLLVYVVSVLLVSLIVRGGLGDSSTLAQTFLLPWSLLTGVVAREVMLWTGFAIGGRGKRVRRRNRAAREAYESELAERRDAGASA